MKRETGDEVKWKSKQKNYILLTTGKKMATNSKLTPNSIEASNEEQCSPIEKWLIQIRNKDARILNALPKNIKAPFDLLKKELSLFGTIVSFWHNYGPIKGAVNHYHCHLKKGKPTYVVVWQVVPDENIIKIKYIGTHEGVNYSDFK